MPVVAMLYSNTFQAHILDLPLPMLAVTFAEVFVCAPANVNVVCVVQEVLVLPAVYVLQGVDLFHLSHHQLLIEARIMPLLLT